MENKLLTTKIIGSIIGKYIIDVRADTALDSPWVAIKLSDRSDGLNAVWWVMEHGQDCCEWVRPVDLPELSASLRGVKIMGAEEVTERHSQPIATESATWTFYKFSTSLEDFTIRWLGESNGWYSEDVYYGFETITPSPGTSLLKEK